MIGSLVPLSAAISVSVYGDAVALAATHACLPAALEKIAHAFALRVAGVGEVFQEIVRRLGLFKGGARRSR